MKTCNSELFLPLRDRISLPWSPAASLALLFLLQLITSGHKQSGFSAGLYVNSASNTAASFSLSLYRRSVTLEKPQCNTL